MLKQFTTVNIIRRIYSMRCDLRTGEQGRRQVLIFFFGGGGASVGLSLRGVSLFVSRMLLPSFIFLPKNLGAVKPPPCLRPWGIRTFRDRGPCSGINKIAINNYYFVTFSVHDYGTNINCKSILPSKYVYIDSEVTGPYSLEMFGLTPVCGCF